jgi:hypothetical protein
MTSLSVPYTFRGQSGRVQVSVTVNTEPARFGCDLLTPSSPSAATGFPVCLARPEIPLDGYAAACGWIQLVRSSDATGEFEMDPLAVFGDVATPFAFFGIAPTLFDAPSRPSRDDLTWRARSFLAALPDGVRTKRVHPLVAFEWGFTVVDQTVSVQDASALDLAAWDEHRPLLAGAHPGWGFAPSAQSRGI